MLGRNSWRILRESVFVGSVVVLEQVFRRLTQLVVLPRPCSHSATVTYISRPLIAVPVYLASTHFLSYKLLDPVGLAEVIFPEVPVWLVHSALHIFLLSRSGRTVEILDVLILMRLF